MYATMKTQTNHSNCDFTANLGAEVVEDVPITGEEVGVELTEEKMFWKLFAINVTK